MKIKNLATRIAVTLIAVVTVFTGISFGSHAEDLPYDTYNYDYRENIVKTPAAYVPAGSVTGLSSGAGDFKEPEDMCIAPDGKLYVADTGNNRIVVLSENLRDCVKIIDSFEMNGEKQTFGAPKGVCVSQNNQLYIADSNNRRIVVLELDGSFVKIVDNPQSEILEDGFDFVPLKVTVDYADRVYVIVKNAFEGILVFESTGEFTGYYGTIEVKISVWEKFWRRLASKEERAKQQLFIPTEFTGIDVDDDGFIYASNLDSDGIQGVRRLNPQGKDVIQKGENGNVGGDLTIGKYGDYGGPSEFTDVVYRGKGIYSCLDKKRGRIFTYDKEGNLLYVFGGLGTQEGTFVKPVAIECVGSNILVMDSLHNSVMIFEETRYGNLINTAVGLRYDGDETQAIQLWQEVLELDENNELANTGIGKAYLTAGDNKMAMHYLELGMNRNYYSIAYKRYRNEILAENLNWIMTLVIVLIVVWIVYKKFFRSKVKKLIAAKKDEKKNKMVKGGHN
ncbi:MAG: NHL repeat-containing protein [Lachnospiraceae bacterium]|nr:NHL repeat-containing protein [Candidatus Merdinaster equi]